MTFWAEASKDAPAGSQVDVHVTYGPVSVKVAEHTGSLRAFWESLGRVLDAAEEAGRTEQAGTDT